MMEIYFKAALILVVIIVAFFLSRKIISEQNQLKKIIKCRDMRREKGCFDLKNYIDEKKYYKDRDWLFQRNRGIDPCKMGKPVNIRQYSDGCDYIIMKKGM